MYVSTQISSRTIECANVICKLRRDYFWVFHKLLGVTRTAKMNITRQDDHDVSKYMVRYGKKLTKHLDNLRCLFSEHHSWIIENETLQVLREHHLEIIKQMIFEKVKKKQLQLYVKSIRAMINQLDGHAANQEGDDYELHYEQLKIDTKIYIKSNKWQLWFWKSDQRYFKWDYGLQQLCRPIHSLDHLHYVLEQLLDIADIGEFGLGEIVFHVNFPSIWRSSTLGLFALPGRHQAEMGRQSKLRRWLVDCRV